MEQIAASLLVLDYRLYPRNHVDEANVRDIKVKIQAKANLPPIVVDRASNRVVDGFHRLHAHMELLGPETLVSVEWRGYPSDRELFLDAVELNADHGQKLTKQDISRITIISEELGIDPSVVAGRLHTTMAVYDALTLRRGVRPKGYGQAPGPSNAPVAIPLKEPFRWRNGDQFTEAEVVAMKKAQMPFVFHCRQVELWLDQPSLLEKNASELATARRLRDKLVAAEWLYESESIVEASLPAKG